MLKTMETHFRHRIKKVNCDTSPHFFFFFEFHKSCFVFSTTDVKIKSFLIKIKNDQIARNKQPLPFIYLIWL